MILLLAVFLFRCALTEVIPTPIVAINLTPLGFHRELYYTIYFDYPIAGKDCEFYLEQEFPSSVYINTDQLENLKRLGKFNGVFPKFIDVEIPTEKAEGFKVLLYGMPKITGSVSLPVHFRYHSPRNGGGYKTVEIDSPTFYFRCPDEKFESWGITNASLSNYCLNKNDFVETDEIFGENCDWKQIEYQLILKNNGLRADIPIGDENIRKLVLYLTVAVSWIGSFCVAFTLFNKMQIINKKLS